MEQALYELPEGWDFPQLGSIARLVGGATPSKKEKKYWDGDIKWASVRDLNVDDLVHTEYRITDEGLASCSSNIIPKGNLVIATRVGLGKVSRAKVDVAINQDLRGVIPNSEIDVDYLYFWFKQKAEFIESCGTGATVKGVKIDFIKSLKIPLPPLNEQKRIVTKLDALFTRIDTATTHLQQTLELSKALFASALDGEFSSLFDRVNISDVADVKGGKRLPKGNKLQDEPSNHPYIRVADFTNAGSIDVGGLKYISDEIYQQIKRYTITSRDLYISIAGTIGKTGIVPEELDGANLTENAAKLVFKQPNNIDVRYIYYFTLSHDFSEQAGLATKVVAQPKLALTRLSKIQVPVPQIEMQQRIVVNLDTLSDRTRALEAATQEKLDDLTTLKASLLDAAFKGQL